MMSERLRRESRFFWKALVASMSLVLLAVLFMTVLIGATWVIESVFYLLTGWVGYALRSASEVRIDWTAVATAGIALALFTLGMHIVLKWLLHPRRRPVKERQWRIQGSLRVTALIVIAFIAGTSTVGIAHQITWLTTTDERLLKSNFSTFEEIAEPVPVPVESEE